VPSLVSSVVKLTINSMTKDTEIREVKEIRGVKEIKEIKGIVILVDNQADGILDKHLNSRDRVRDRDRDKVSIREVPPLEILTIHKVLHRNNTAH
jgi:hypothetical protein